MCGLAALGGAAGGADEAAFLVDEGLGAAVGAALAGGLGAVGQVFFEGSFYAHFPCVDGLAVEFEASDEFEDLVYGHAVAEYAGDEFRVVPVFGVEFVAEAGYYGAVAAFVDKLEVVTFVAVGVYCFYYFAFCD